MSCFRWKGFGKRRFFFHEGGGSITFESSFRRRILIQLDTQKRRAQKFTTTTLFLGKDEIGREKGESLL